MKGQKNQVKVPWSHRAKCRVRNVYNPCTMALTQKSEAKGWSRPDMKKYIMCPTEYFLWWDYLALHYAKYVL